MLKSLMYSLFLLLLATSAVGQKAVAQVIDTEELHALEAKLEDVMEVTDTIFLRTKLSEVEGDYASDSTRLNALRLGLIYHEAALNFSLLANEAPTGYAQKSYDLLSTLQSAPETSKAMLPFVASYRASALALVAAETNSLKLLSQSFDLFKKAVSDYAEVSYLPEFLRGSVSENLPWFMFFKARYARIDFGSIINKYGSNSDYAPDKIMSFTYWAWANNHQGKKHRAQALTYLDNAIMLDPNYNAARARAEVLKAQLFK